MIIKCRVCAGSGRVNADLFDFGTKPCPACGAAGELDLHIAKERLTTCKFCAGRGVIQQSLFELVGRVCPTCKGLGLVGRPLVGSLGLQKETAVPTAGPRPTSFEYDIAISYAGEDRQVVRPYADSLVENNLRIFFADFEQVGLWGTNLYETFDAIYRLKARYCVLFLSQHYANKVWTNHERRAAQARAVQENREYILPVRLDDTDIPGLSPTIGYLEWNKVGLTGLVEATLKKVGGRRVG